MGNAFSVKYLILSSFIVFLAACGDARPDAEQPSDGAPSEVDLVASTVGSARSTLSAPTRVSASQMVCFAARVMIATSDCSAMKRWEPVSNASRMKLAHPARFVLGASARSQVLTSQVMVKLARPMAMIAVDSAAQATVIARMGSAILSPAIV